MEWNMQVSQKHPKKKKKKKSYIFLNQKKTLLQLVCIMISPFPSPYAM